MAAARWVMWRYGRERGAALAALALVVMLGAAGTLVAAGAADRTANAYSRYIERAEVGDAVINPSLFSTDVDRVIRGLPGVRSVTTDALFLAGVVDDDMPRTWGELWADDDFTQVRGSADGRYTTMDRPALAEGRMPTGADEVLVSVELVHDRGLAVGDTLPLAFLNGFDDMTAEPDDPVVPLAVEQVTVVGVATFADEVLPDGLFPRGRVLIGPELADRYDCLPGPIPPNATLAEAARAMAPPGCATPYRYWSLAVDGGTAGVAAALDAFVRESAVLNDALPDALQEVGAGHYLIATTTAEDRVRVERSIQPTVTALVVLAVVAGAVTLAALALLVARELRRTDDDVREWWRLGTTRTERALAVGVPAFAAVVVGLAAALVLAWALSPVAPLGSARAVDPSPPRSLSGWSVLAGTALAVVAVVVVAALAFRAAGRVTRPGVARREVPAAARLVARSGRPAVAEGVRAAYGASRGAGLVVATGALAAGVVLAAATFAASLSAMLATPSAYGWAWDVAVLAGAGYGNIDDPDAAAAAARDHRAVRAATWLGMTNDVVVDGEPVFSLVALDGTPDSGLAVAQGRLPRDPDEVALGARTAAERGVGVGDRVAIEGDGIEARRATVTGIAVLPAIGQFQADRASPGRGAVLPLAMFDRDVVAVAPTFVGLDLADGADPRAVARDVEGAFLSDNGMPPLSYDQAVRPAEIVDARAMRSIPLLVGALLAAGAVVGLAVAVVLSVRSRRRELATLRALGFTGGQIRTSVRVQAVATVAAALAVGAPLGIAAGRVTWRAFASRLGVAQDPTIPLWWVAVTVVGAFAVALVAAAVPARMAARIHPATVLRAE